MNIQISDLMVTDPLAEQEVAVVVRVLPDSAQRPARTALVSVGMSGQLPVFVSGVLEDVADLVRQTWLAYGVRADVHQNSAEDSTDAVVETVAEAIVDDEDGDAESSALAPTQAEPQAPPAQPCRVIYPFFSHHFPSLAGAQSIQK